MGKVRTTRIMKATVRLVTSEAGLTKFQAASVGVFHQPLPGMLSVCLLQKLKGP